MESGTQFQTDKSQLAIYDRRRTDKTETLISETLNFIMY